MIRRRWRLACLFLVALAMSPVAGRLPAQSLTNGSIRGVVAGVDGQLLALVQVSLERLDGRVMHALETGRDGGFAVPLVQPGTYRVLLELVGYQPLRITGVPVAAGETTVLSARLEPRPPPILAVVEVQFSGAMGGTALGPILDQGRLTTLDQRLSFTDLARDVSEVDGPRDGRPGFALGAAGLPGSRSELYVDGFPEVLLRHPGVPGEPASAPLFSREGLAQARVVGAGFDAEWRGYPGVVLTGNTARGGDRVAFRPYAMASTSSLGGAAEDNPADSAGTSFQLGGTLSGAIVPDTAHFALRFDYQRLQTPGAYPWAVDTAQLAGSQVSLRETLPELGSDVYGAALGPAVAPVVRTWEGYSGLGRFDWRIGQNLVLARFGYARWTEESPQLALDLSNLSGAELEAKDLSAALSVTTSTPSIANELRASVTSSTRDWTSTGLPATSLVAEGIAFGGSGALPGKFDRQTVDIADAIQARLGSHRFKLGLDLQVNDYTYDYSYGSSGIFTFGNLDGFAGGEGTYFQITGASQAVRDFRIADFGGFLQDTWSASPEVDVQFGLRYDTQRLPDDLIQQNADWVAATGISNAFVPEDSKGLSPRLGLVWDVQGRGEWIVTGGGGLFQGRLDPGTLAEAGVFDGAAMARRGVGSFEFWPSLPDAVAAPTLGPRLTLFNDSYRNPRTFKTGIGVKRGWPSGVSLRLEGLYAHTDYLPQRTDLNLAPDPVGQTQEDRPVYGQLTQLGGLVTPEPGSNRRFHDFDLVMGLSPTGFANHAEFTFALERRVERGVRASLSYTFSHTEDNTPGLRSADPADQLSPFPDGLGAGAADWTEARSDFDVPHRFVAFAEYRGGGTTPIGLGARFRYRSGLPFTPGFRPGVDINGDGSGGNDPAYLLGSIPELQGLLTASGCDLGPANEPLARNSCREEAHHALDARLEVGLPVTFEDGSRLSLVLDAFNLITSDMGVVDRALVLVDPTGSLTSSGGVTTVPLIANPNFGNLLSRRTDPRLFRVGLRVGY